MREHRYTRTNDGVHQRTDQQESGRNHITEQMKRPKKEGRLWGSIHGYNHKKSFVWRSFHSHSQNDNTKNSTEENPQKKSKDE